MLRGAGAEASVDEGAYSRTNSPSLEQRSQTKLWGQQTPLKPNSWSSSLANLPVLTVTAECRDEDAILLRDIYKANPEQALRNGQGYYCEECSKVMFLSNYKWMEWSNRASLAASSSLTGVRDFIFMKRSSNLIKTLIWTCMRGWSTFRPHHGRRSAWRGVFFFILRLFKRNNVWCMVWP